MIEHVTEASTSDWYAAACHRAVASRRRRRSEKASTEWPSFAPPVELSEGPLGVVQAADREIARQTALRARGVAAFAAERPADVDRAQGEKGAMSPERWAARPEVLRPVSEWAARELMVALSISDHAANELLTRSLLLVHRLPGTLAALEAGALHPGHLWPLLEHVAPIADDQIRAEVEAELLRWAAGRIVTPSQLGDKARREATHRDARAALRRLERAVADRGVHLQDERTAGMAAVTASLTVPEAHALYRALGAYADAIPDDPGAPVRTRGQKMADCLLDLVLRPGEHGHAPVQVMLTVVASIAALAGGDEPCEIDGRVVPPEVVRALLRAVAPHLPQQRSDASVPSTEPDNEIPALESDDGRAAAPSAGHQSAAAQAELEAWLAEQADFSVWSDELERRLLSGELVDPDEPLPFEQIGAGPVDPEFLAWLADDALYDGPDTDADPERDRRPPDPAEDEGWWAEADRAVDEASRAALRATQSLGHARRAVRRAVLADEADEDSWRQSPNGRLVEAVDALDALAVIGEEKGAWLADLLAATGGGGLVDRPRIAVTNALTGALLALTDLPELRRTGHCGRRRCRRQPARCDHDLSGRPGIGPPCPTDAYRPSASLDRYLRARDRRCRFPGCRRRVPRGGELDHDVPYPLGETSADNMAGYCTADHRGKHQAPGWKHELEPDGTLTVTTPTGLVAATTPPPY
jgi:hypothetical protein